jgi:hypothetical protein
MANIIPSQKIARTALDFFIVLFFLLRASVMVFRLHRDQTAADPLRFSAGDVAQELPKKASKIFCPRAPNLLTFTKEKVTELLPAQHADVLPAFKR